MNTKKLKQLVLDLAIHGKLVPQDPNDEPASELLKRIQADVETHGRASNKSKGKKTAVSSVDLDEVPFEVPEGWCWCKVTDVLTKITDGTHHSPTNLPTGDFMYVTAKNIKPQGLDLSNITYVDKATHDEIYSRCNPEYGDILYVKDGATTGIACLNTIKEPFSLLSSVALLKPSKLILSNYLLRYLQSSYCYGSVRETMKGVGITRITLTLIGEWLIPLPPLAEQHRIVAAIEKWFAVIDQLEKNEADLKKSIEQTKKKVLDLAIRGKLVESEGEWEEKRLKEIATVLYGYPFNSNLFNIMGEGFPLIRIRDVVPSYTETYTTEEADDQYIIHKGDMIIGMDGNFNIGFWNSDDAYLNQRVCKVTANPAYVNQKYLSYQMQKCLSDICDNVSFMTVKHLSDKHLSQMIIPLPSLSEQQRIVDKVDEVLELLERIER